MSHDLSKQGLSEKSLKKSLIAGTIGVFVHWFDWAIYAYLAGTLAHVFFPSQSGTAGLLAVFGVLAISFAVRPIGALLFGYLGDRVGRQKTLSIVILAMAAGTLVLGLVPGYSSIGTWAPLLLVSTRVIQGLAAGGEFGSAAAFMAEYSPTKHRGFGVSWIEVGSLLGFLAASLAVYALTASMSPEALQGWGWRIPFLLSAPLGIVGYYIRTKIEDTPEFRKLAAMDHVAKSPLKEVMTRNIKEVFQASGIEMMMNVTFYIVLVYLLTYQEDILGWSASKAALLSASASIIAVFIVPISGALSDRYGRKPVLLLPAIALIVLSYPLTMLMHVEADWAGVVSTIALGAILAVILGAHAVTCAELFPTRTRQSGLSVAYQVTSALFAGTVPYVLTWLIHGTGNDMFLAFYLILVGFVGFVSVISIKETKGIDLLAEDDIKGQVEPSAINGRPQVSA